MKRSSGFTLGSIALAVMTSFAFVGVTTGSLAWYAYSRTVRVSYVGTSVAKSVLLNVGIVDDNNYLNDDKLTEYELDRTEIDGHSIVFTHSTNGLDYHAIQDYLFWSPYAVSTLFPLSTQTRSLTDTSPLTLYKSPDYGDITITDAAKLTDYVRIPFAFRMEERVGDDIPDTDIWLTDVAIQASGEHIDRSVRLFFDNGTNRFLMRPYDRGTENGYTKVAGMLDLDGDETYDYDALTHQEYYYGQHTGVISYEEDLYGERFADDPEPEIPFDNVNGVADDEMAASTFYAKHNLDAKLVNASELTPNRAEYYSFGYVKPSVDSSGAYYAGETGIPITQIDHTTGLGYVTLTIFIEGWDHSVVDKASGYSFNLGLKFEVSRS